MHSICDEAPKEITTEETPTLDVVDEPPTKPLQGRHLSISNLFAISMMCLKVKYMYCHVTIGLELQYYLHELSSLYFFPMPLNIACFLLLSYNAYLECLDGRSRGDDGFLISCAVRACLSNKKHKMET